MIWKNVILHIIRASLLTIMLPAIVVAFIFVHFGLTVDSLLAMLFLGELYIVWAQLEVAMRQSHLTMLGYEPEFQIEIKNVPAADKPWSNLFLTNIGSHHARNVFISIDAGPQREHKFKTFLSPKETILLCSLDYETLKNSVIKIDISYETTLGVLSTTSLMKTPELPIFIVSKPVRMPGILLNSFEELFLVWRALTLPRKIKKLREKG